MQRRSHLTAAWICCLAVLAAATAHAAPAGTIQVATIVDQVIRPVMEQYAIPGMAVGVVTPGQAEVLNRGVMSKTTLQPVTDATLFEIGSISKTFTATLAAYAAAKGALALSDTASQALPSLRGSSFDRVSVLNLATHTAGGLPLLVPNDITDQEQLMTWLHGWQPAHAPGSSRSYTNIGIMLLGLTAAQRLHRDFVPALQDDVLAGLGLQHSWLEVPGAQLDNYAQGYTSADMPARMTAGVLAAESYGIRTTVGDMLRYVEANLGMLKLDPTLQQAISSTHTGYYRVGPMTQDLVWEQYGYPVALRDLLAGNSDKMLLQANPAVAYRPPLPPRDDVLINKTGSTNGFAAYVAFVPARQLGIVLLANKDYPIAARVRAAYEILTRLEGNAARH